MADAASAAQLWLIDRLGLSTGQLVTRRDFLARGVRYTRQAPRDQGRRRTDPIVPPRCLQAVAIAAAM